MLLLLRLQLYRFGFETGFEFQKKKKYIFTKWLRASLEMKLAERASTFPPTTTHWCAVCRLCVGVAARQLATVDPPGSAWPPPHFEFAVVLFDPLSTATAAGRRRQCGFSMADQRSSAQPWVGRMDRVYIRQVMEFFLALQQQSDPEEGRRSNADFFN